MPKKTYIEELLEVYRKDKYQLQAIYRDSIEALKTFNDKSEIILQSLSQLQQTPPFWTKSRIIQISLYAVMTILLAGAVILAISRDVTVMINLTEGSFQIIP